MNESEQLFERLLNRLKNLGGAAIALSGGVDSCFLAYAAACADRENFAAYYVKSAFQPEFELSDALRTAQELGLTLKVISVDILACGEVVCNPADRCYHCKKRIFSAICKAAAADGFTTILDGTNASDAEDDRPGMRALKEIGVLSPLRECGLTKADIRRLAHEAELFTWNKPSYACLATRIPTGQRITASLLRRTEEAESYLFSLGFTDFRVRTVGDMAKLQLRERQLPLLLEHREEILNKLGCAYSSVCLDLEVRK